MSNREERFRAAAYLAQLIAENDTVDDALHLEQAFDDVTDGVDSARRNQTDGLPALTAAAFQRLTGHKPRLVVVDSAGFSVRVEPKEAS